MPEDSDSAPAKGLCDQIRSVHLVLLLVAFIILATSLETPNRTIENSVRDARSIYNLASSMDITAGAVGKEVRDKAEKYVSQMGDNSQKEREINLEITWPDSKEVVTLYGPLGALYLSDAQYESEDDLHDPAYSIVYFRVRSLADFIRFWNHNNEDQFVIVPKILQANITNVDREQGLQLERAKSFRLVSQKAKPENTYQLHANREGEKLTFYTYSAEHKGEPRITITVPLLRIPGINVQASLRKYAQKEQEWIPGTFESTFPELSARSKNLTSLDLKDLVTELNDQANREREKIDLLGAKWKPDLIGRWGLLIMAICQFYLWLHLAALSETVPNGAAVSVWVGLYKSRWALGFTLGSFFVPATIATFLVFWQFTTTELRWRLVSDVNASVCLILAVVSAYTLLRVRQSLKTPQPRSTAV